MKSRLDGLLGSLDEFLEEEQFLIARKPPVTFDIPTVKPFIPFGKLVRCAGQAWKERRVL